MTELKPMTIIQKIIFYTIIVFFIFISIGVILALVVFVDAPNQENKDLVFYGLVVVYGIFFVGGLIGIVRLFSRQWKVKIDFF